MKGIREWWRGRRSGAPAGGSGKGEPFAEQFAMLVRDDWRERIAELQATCRHTSTTVYTPPGGGLTKTVCANCGLRLPEEGVK